MTRCIASLVAAATLAQAGPPAWSERLAFWSRAELGRLDARVSAVDAELSTLAEMALVNSCLRIGLKTGYTTAEDVRWIELTLPEPALADAVVLVPPLAKGASAVVAGYGFPVRFKLEVFDEQDTPLTILDRTAEDFPNPGCYPVVARFEPRRVKKARFTATDPWTVDGPEVLALAEMLVLSGARHAALDAQVRSSSSRSSPRAWTRANLIDMATPLGLPVAPQAGGTNGFHSAVAAKSDEVKWLTLELPEIAELDEIRLVPARVREVPLWFDYGFPVLYKVEAATRADFSDAVLLHEVTDRLHPTPGANLVCLPARGVRAKFIRVTARQLWYRRSDYVFALAEMQALRGGENLALRGTFTASDEAREAEGKEWSLSALNDGLTEDGRLIELPEWFAHLEERRALEAERARLVEERETLARRAQQQLVYGSVSGMGAAALALGFMFWRQRRQRRLDAQRLQDKLARDLHDEIGSNLGSITLICSMAAQPGTSAGTLREDLVEIGRVAAETADSMRDMVDLLRTRRVEHEHDWLDVLHRLTERLLRGLALDCALPAAPLTHDPDPETRREIYLFCKEVLHNTARHARATRARFHLTPTREGLRVEISDNGTGFDMSQPAAGNGLGNLRERAAGMKARLEITSAPGNGTAIHLDVPASGRWQRRTRA